MRSLLLALAVLSAAACDLSVTEIPREKRLSPEEIATRLRSDDFPARLEARKQLDSLPEPDRVRLLQGVLRSKDPADRIVALQALSTIQNADARATIEQAQGDPDQSVAATAKDLLAPPSEGGGESGVTEDVEAE